jgi:carbon-monoxide dehydrogenase large subunit
MEFAEASTSDGAHLKGIGDAGVLPIPAAIISAVEDALAPLGIRISQFPIRPRDLAAMIADAGAGACEAG